MRNTETILLIDDEDSFIRTYQALLGGEGYFVEVAKDAKRALDLLDTNKFGLILLDQKLRGRDGPDSGLDLIVEIQKRVPDAKIIIVTAYAAPLAIERAFAAGVYDYLEKNEIFASLLRAKVRNAFSLTREQHVPVDADAREAELQARWKEVRAERDNNRKGKLLEDLLALLFRTVPGWHVRTDVRNDIEEIDVVIRNESSDLFWSRQGDFLLAECKHWSKPVGDEQLRSFLWKLHHKYDRCRLGFFVTTNRFTQPFHDTLLSEQRSNVVVVPIDEGTLDGLVQSRDRSAMLKDLCEQAIFRTKNRPTAAPH